MVKSALFPVDVAKRIYEATCGGAESEFSEHRRPSSKGGGGAKLVKTPSGGIDGATLASGEYTLGSATCVVYKITVVSGVRKANATSESIVVSNSVPIKIKGNALIHVKKIDGEYLVDVEPCTITYSETP